MVAKSDIKNVFEVFSDGIKYYFKHFPIFAKYMCFPVFGQFLGLIVITFTTTIFLSIQPNLITKYEIFQNPWILLATSIAVTLPGLAILFRAFWRYIAAYGTITSMASNLKSGKLYDIAAHDELINRAAIQYIFLWLLFGLFTLVAIIPFFWVPAMILFVYFVLIFQVFTFDEINASAGNAINSFKQSFGMIKGHFLVTFILLILVGGLTCVLIPHLITFVVLKAPVVQIILEGLKVSPETLIYPHLTAQTLAEGIISLLISSILVMFTLPMRTITWTLWYKKLAPKFHREQRKISKKSNVVKLDKRILDRAMEDYE